MTTDGHQEPTSAFVRVNESSDEFALDARHLLLLLFAVLFTGRAHAENFLVVVADDLGVDGVEIYSRDDLYGHDGEGANPGPTPTINALAEQGILFRNAYAYSQCSPTRAAALTGRDGFRNGIGSPGGAFLALSETTLAELLGPTHVTAAVGKWHLSAGDIDHPIDQGFAAYAGPLANVSSYTSWDKTTNSSSTSGSTTSDVTTYVTTDNADEAIAAIVAAGSSPWFVWLAFSAPHTPFHVPPSNLTTIPVDAGSDNPTKFKAAVEAMDTELERVLSALTPTLLEETTIIFLGDNGTPRGATEAPFIASHAKGTLYEGGINVPLIVRSPHVPLVHRGSESLALVNATDLFATIAELAGVPSTAEDAVSMVPLLADPTAPSLRRCAYAESFTPNSGPPYDDEERAALDGRYKLIWRNGSFEEMFDLENDRWENSSLLPLVNPSPLEVSAYADLSDAISNRTCALPPTVSEPALPTAGWLTAVAALALLGASVAREGG